MVCSYPTSMLVCRSDPGSKGLPPALVLLVTDVGAGGQLVLVLAASAVQRLSGCGLHDYSITEFVVNTCSECCRGWRGAAVTGSLAGADR